MATSPSSEQDHCVEAPNGRYSPVRRTKSKEEMKRPYTLKGPINRSTRRALSGWSNFFSRLLRNSSNERLQSAYRLSSGNPAAKAHGQDSVELIACYTFPVPGQIIKSQHARRAMTFNNDTRITPPSPDPPQPRCCVTAEVETRTSKKKKKR